MAHAAANGKFARPNTFEVDLGAIARCVRQIRARIGPDIYFIGTLKSNAYGYGLIPAAKTVVAAGADALSLVSLDDAVALRRAGIRAPILVYAGTVPAKNIVTACEKHDLIPTLHSDESFAAFARYASRPLDVAVKVDVGQERIGVPAEQAVAFVKAVAGHPKLRVHILNTHPSVTGKGRSADVLQWQYERFVAVCDELEQAGIRIPFKVVASSKILRMTGRAMTLNAVDPGAALFSSLDPDLSDEQYQPFHALKSRLIQVRDVFRTDFPEEAPFRLAPDMRIGVAPIGYSDGVHRLNCGEVLVRGKRVPILGSPALEYTRIDLSLVPDAAVGDDVVIIGRQAEGRISPEEVAQKQAAARVSDLALEVRPAITRVYVDSRGESLENARRTEGARS
jgi:alanine racemase